MAERELTLEEERFQEEAAHEKRRALSPQRSKMPTKYKVLLIVVGLLLMAVLRTGFVFIVIAMLPSVVAYYVDVGKHRYLFRTICACNLAGLFPILGIMLRKGPSNGVLQSIMGEAGNWFMIYGFSLFGWLLMEICPIFAAVLVRSFHQAQAARIERFQKKIESEWGAEVLTVTQNIIEETEE